MSRFGTERDRGRLGQFGLEEPEELLSGKPGVLDDRGRLGALALSVKGWGALTAVSYSSLNLFKFVKQVMCEGNEDACRKNAGEGAGGADGIAAATALRERAPG